MVPECKQLSQRRVYCEQDKMAWRLKVRTSSQLSAYHREFKTLPLYVGVRLLSSLACNPLLSVATEYIHILSSVRVTFQTNLTYVIAGATEDETTSNHDQQYQKSYCHRDLIYTRKNLQGNLHCHTLW